MGIAVLAAVFALTMALFACTLLIPTAEGQALQIFGPATKPAAQPWSPRKGDRMAVDTSKNEAYLVHEDGTCASFPVVTGRKEVVRYIGRTYNAETPTAEWAVTSRETKADRATFGETGLFLRLSRAGEETAYGIHGNANFSNMVKAEKRYFSMGCVNVGSGALAMIDRTFSENGSLTVTTAPSAPNCFRTESL